jgi:hypothetical protein
MERTWYLLCDKRDNPYMFSAVKSVILPNEGLVVEVYHTVWDNNQVYLANTWPANLQVYGSKVSFDNKDGPLQGDFPVSRVHSSEKNPLIVVVPFGTLNTKLR